MRWVVAIIALHYCSFAYAETQVYLLRGWLGVFSTGMDSMAEKLRANGIRAEAMMHLSWKSAVSKIVEARAAGDNGPLVLVGHSQGANNAIDIARELEKHKIPVDLLITIVPFMQDPVPSNVKRALNYYQSPGWGMALTADAGFKGTLSNVNVASDVGTFHITIDKNPRVQAEVLSEIAATR
jgi:predicted alpha/beta-hydrolase family hydrolase